MRLKVCSNGPHQARRARKGGVESNTRSSAAWPERSRSRATLAGAHCGGRPAEDQRPRARDRISIGAAAPPVRYFLAGSACGAWAAPGAAAPVGYARSSRPAALQAGAHGSGTCTAGHDERLCTQPDRGRSNLSSLGGRPTLRWAL